MSLTCLSRRAFTSNCIFVMPSKPKFPVQSTSKSGLFCRAVHTMCASVFFSIRTDALPSGSIPSCVSITKRISSANTGFESVSHRALLAVYFVVIRAGSPEEPSSISPPNQEKRYPFFRSICTGMYGRVGASALPIVEFNQRRRLFRQPSSSP